jgi:hypothetical protein
MWESQVAKNECLPIHMKNSNFDAGRQRVAEDVVFQEVIEVLPVEKRKGVCTFCIAGAGKCPLSE